MPGTLPEMRSRRSNETRGLAPNGAYVVDSRRLSRGVAVVDAEGMEVALTLEALALSLRAGGELARTISTTSNKGPSVRSNSSSRIVSKSSTVHHPFSASHPGNQGQVTLSFGAGSAPRARAALR
jgi:hypothetical protein